MVIWTIGMSGSGKTTLGLELFKILKKFDDKWIFLDGDMIRAIMGEDVGHTIEDRKKNGYRISKLCKVLDMQGFNVIACVLSISHDNQQYNREIFSDYKEIFIDVKLEKLIERDNKNLYKKALCGKIDNVVGIDIDFPRPINPDYVLDNSKDNLDFTDESMRILRNLNINISEEYRYTKENRIKNPEKYQYTDYEGMFFLNKYEKDRQKAIEQLLSKISNENTLKVLVREDMKIERYVDNFINSSKGNKNEDIIMTKSYLIKFWNKVRKKEISENNIKELLKLINKFEVSKKIYSCYENETFKRTSDIYDEYINYIIFSNLLLNIMDLNISKNKKYIIFNTILKLNDLIISIVEQLSEEYEILLTYICLKKELVKYTLVREGKLC